MEQKAVDFIMYIGVGIPTMNSNISMNFRESRTNVVHLMSFGGTHNIPLALDTMLFLYEDTGNYIRVYEKYQIRGGPIVEEIIGVWTETEGLNSTNKSLWERRSYLRGTSLRFTVPRPTYPVLHRVNTTENGDIVNYSGYFLDLLKELEKGMNFTAEISFSIDKKFGSLVDNEWNGMVGMLLRNETDICSFLTFTPQRHNAIGYTIPTLPRVPVSLIAPRNQAPAVNLWVFIDIFPKHVWLIFGGGLILLSLGFLIIQWTDVNDFHKPYDSEKFGLFNSLALPIILLMQLNYDVTLKAVSARGVFFVASLGLHIMFAYYTSDLTARMTSGPSPVPIESFQDVIDGDYKVITRPGTSNHEFLKTAAKGSAMHKFYYGFMHNDPTSFIPKLGDALTYIQTHEKTLLYAPEINILGKTKDFEILIMQETINTQGGK